MVSEALPAYFHLSVTLARTWSTHAAHGLGGGRERGGVLRHIPSRSADLLQSHDRGGEKKIPSQTVAPLSADGSIVSTWPDWLVSPVLEC